MRKNLNKELTTNSLKQDKTFKKKVLLDEPKKVLSQKEHRSFIPSFKFHLIADCLAEVETIKGKDSQDKLKEVLTNLFFDVWDNNQADLVLLFYFLICKTGPDYKMKEMGIGNEIIVKCIAKALGKTDKIIKEENKKIGDLSLIASDNMVKKTKATSSENTKEKLKLSDLFNTFHRLTGIKGKSSTLEKEAVLLDLLNGATSNEIKFIIRFIQGKMNIGASYKTVASAFARIVADKTGSSEKEVDKLLVKTLDQNSDYDFIFDQIVKIVENEEPIQNLLLRCPITPGVPLKPMLAKPTTGIKEIIQRFSGKPFTCEYKYDGFRGHLHYCEQTGVQFFSRNLENSTQTYPEVVAYFLQYAKENNLSSFIIDGEIVPFDVVNNKILPFQALTTRKKKNVDENEITVRVKMFLFDIIYFEGKEVIGEPLKKRREIFKKYFKENEYISYATTMESSDPAEIFDFMNASLVDKCEGLIIKGFSENSAYIPGSRDISWLKLKKDYIIDSKLGDSLDLVPIGATWGLGFILKKKKNWCLRIVLACVLRRRE